MRINKKKKIDKRQETVEREKNCYSLYRYI